MNAKSPLRQSLLLSSDSLKTRLAQGATAAFLINSTATGLSFLAQLLLARVLGVEGYGTYAYVLAWVAVLVTFSTLGFQKTLLRFVAAYQARQEWALLRGVIRYAEARIALAGLAIALVGVSVVTAFGERIAPDLAHCFLIGLIAVPVIALAQTHSWVVRALGLVAAALVPELLFRPALLLLIVGAAMLAGAKVGAAFAMGVTLAAATMALAVVHLAFRRVRPDHADPVMPLDRRAEWRRSAAALFALAGFQILFNQAGVLMVGFLADTATAGIYAVTCRFADLTAFALAAINLVFAPSISALHARGEHRPLQAMVTLTARWISLSSLMIGLPFLLFAEQALRLFGEAFVVGANALRILVIAQILTATAGSVSYLMTMTGHERQAAVSFGCATAVHVILNAVLIPELGLNGAATARALALVAFSVAAIVLVWRALRIVPSVFGGKVLVRFSGNRLQH